jgi:hypothetical protein
MAGDLESGDEIRRLTEDLLGRADAAGRWPTPVDDIVAAAKLDEPEESPCDASWLARAPRYLRKAVDLIDTGRIRALLDRRERTVQLAPGIESEGRKSFLRLHEVTHDLLPWQSDPAFADTDGTLSPTVKRLFEREANQGSAELLFQGERFPKMASDYRIGMGAVTDLANTVGASLRATLRRYAEGHDSPVCAIVLKPSPIRRDPLVYERLEISQSPAWTDRFGSAWPRVLREDAFAFVKFVSSPFGADATVTLCDVNLENTEVRVESMSSRFGILVLLWVPRRELLKRKTVLRRAHD